MSTIATERQALNPSALIELFVLDMSLHNAGTLLFCSTSNPFVKNVVWQGNEYVALPIIAAGFAQRSSGSLPRPTIKISNYQGLIGAQARETGDLLGSRVIRKRTFARFLDAVNFPEGNPEADPTQQMRDEVWIVDRKSSETPDFVEFELAAEFDVPGVKIPLRQYVQNTCQWLYRGESCGYQGETCFDEQGNPVADKAQDRCGKKMSDCKLRNNEQRFGAFPGSGLLRG